MLKRKDSRSALKQEERDRTRMNDEQTWKRMISMEIGGEEEKSHLEM